MGDRRTDRSSAEFMMVMFVILWWVINILIDDRFGCW